MAQTKDKHYWTQLRAALTAGQWTSPAPAHDPRGEALPWPELLRKFNKHVRGFADVAQIAAQTQSLASLIVVCAQRESDGGESGIRTGAVEDADEGGLLLGEEQLLGSAAAEEREEARRGYEALGRMEGQRSDSVHLALAYFAYALGQPDDCLKHIAKVSQILDANAHVPAEGSTRSVASGLLTPSSTASSSSTWTDTWTGSFASADSQGTPTDIKDGRAWAMTESMRSLCLQGMSLEKLRPDDPELALQTYASALPLINTIKFDLPLVPAPSATLSPRPARSARTTTPPSSSSPASFAPYRELWRWTERLMFRGIALAARTRPLDDALLWTLFAHYHDASAHWPPAFQPHRRGTVAHLHLRALVVRFGATATPPQKAALTGERPPQWLATARSVINDYRAVLAVATRFPKAGERNVKVEEFVDLCVAVWEAAGAVPDRARWVLDVLWWATRLTFNSYRVFRHMTRLLYVSGDVALARRTLRLYTQVVGKARQAGLGENQDTDRHWVEALVDGARMFCRLALEQLARDGGGTEETEEAQLCVEKAKERLDEDDKELVARVALAEGVWNLVAALTEQNPHTRPARLSMALAQLIKSVGTYPTPSAHHHLAVVLSLPGPTQSIDEAISAARAAVESEPSEVRYWHLLALLLTANGQWAQAKGVLEVGADIGEPDEPEPEPEPEGGALMVPVPGEGAAVNGNGGTTLVPEDGVKVRDFEAEKQTNGVGSGLVGTSLAASSAANPSSSNGGTGASTPVPAPLRAAPQTLVARNATTLPPAGTLLRGLPDHPVAAPQDAFEYALQLRMTQMALTEHVEGPEGADVQWVDVFSWVAERKANASFEAQARSSTDTTGGQSVATTRAPSMASPSVSGRSLAPDSAKEDAKSQMNGDVAEKDALTNANANTNTSSTGNSLTLPMPDSVPSITVTPGTPAEPTYPYVGIEETFEKSPSHERGGDPSASKKMQQMLKNRVHKGQEKISTISKKIGHNVVRRGGSLRRSSSAPDFITVMQGASFQASSIASRRRIRSVIRQRRDSLPAESPPPPPLPALPPVASENKAKPVPVTREDKLLSELWAMSAATFRRLGKIEQAKGAIQEAEVKDGENPSVWVQLGLYHHALNHDRQAVEAFQKALFFAPDDISATVHLCRMHLDSTGSSSTGSGSGSGPGGEKADGGRGVEQDKVDLSAGMLAYATKTTGWNVPEAWYFLAKAYGLQGRKDRERGCLKRALELSEKRTIRDIGSAIGWCL